MNRAATIALVLIAALVALAAVSAYSAELSGAEAAQCEAEGGCALVTVSWLHSALTRAYQSGREAEARACKMPMT